MGKSGVKEQEQEASVQGACYVVMSGFDDKASQDTIRSWGWGWGQRPVRTCTPQRRHSCQVPVGRMTAGTSC